MNASIDALEDAALNSIQTIRNGMNTRNVLMGVVGILLNTVGLVLLGVSKRVRLTLKITLMSMALNDWIFMLDALLYGLGTGCWLNLYIVVGSVMVSYFVTSSLAVHNYVAVFYPLRCREILSIKRSLVLMASCWLGGYLIALAALGVNIPPGASCYVVTVMARTSTVSLSFLCLICCCFTTASSGRVLVCIRGRYRQSSLGAAKILQKRDLTNSSSGEPSSRRVRARCWPFCRSAVGPLSGQIAKSTQGLSQPRSISFISPGPRMVLVSEPTPSSSTAEDETICKYKPMNPGLYPMFAKNQPCSLQSDKAGCSKQVVDNFLVHKSSCTKEPTAVIYSRRQRSNITRRHFGTSQKLATDSLQTKTASVSGISGNTFLQVPTIMGVRRTKCIHTTNTSTEYAQRVLPSKALHPNLGDTPFIKDLDRNSVIDSETRNFSSNDVGCSRLFNIHILDQLLSKNKNKVGLGNSTSKSTLSQILNKDDNFYKLLKTSLTVPLHTGYGNVKSVSPTGTASSYQLKSSTTQNEPSKSYHLCVKGKYGKGKKFALNRKSFEGHSKNSLQSKPQECLNVSPSGNILVETSKEENISIFSEDRVANAEMHYVLKDTQKTNSPLTPENQTLMSIPHQTGLSTNLQRATESSRGMCGKISNANSNKHSSSQILLEDREFQTKFQAGLNTQEPSCSLLSPKKYSLSEPCEKDVVNELESISDLSSGDTNTLHYVRFNDQSISTTSESPSSECPLPTNISVPGTLDPTRLILHAGTPPSLTRHHRARDGSSTFWRYRTQYTLLILCGWCCFLSLPYVVYVTNLAIWVEDRERFLQSTIGVFCSSLIALNSITNPLLYAWRFVEWRDIWKRIKRRLSSRI
ncbi:hypothetical protein ElyMa_002939600 [Elysia marginata]|uniref:G-protein coupled receptors family 1 profile domain-containing protein n=1 Tax=Elysia marginata TaxID=1093978 RepID=A0AAV4I552_9GAST|nr:hypothetical protein ElyMa_002939600 [Elysia marginata]